MKKHLPAVIVTLIVLAFVALGALTIKSCFAWQRNPAVAFLLKTNPEIAGKVKCTDMGYSRDTKAFAADCELDTGESVYCNSGGTQSKPYCERYWIKPGSQAAKIIEDAQKQQADAKAAADKAADKAAKEKADAEAKAKADADAAAKSKKPAAKK